ncbi:RnfABCDGE type electron transport complex subunit D [Halorhodospira halochloris]|uniref:RnfABCDGE type electron transport complex subunit D n=1 Tax=Halorhodospira halochloris TaxID=1052 RepID=UPI0023793197|nr:RnfABCDGE type electron transport complex subunit D [Halorhodospira halochloris]
MATQTTPRIMGEVLLASIPAAAVMVWLFGVGILLNTGAALLAALLAEALGAHARGQSPRVAVSDGSVWVTALLIGITLPPVLPWWIPALAGALAILLGKQVYGGLGQNVFNPAMVGYVAVVLAFPQATGLWPAPDPGLTAAIPSGEALSYFLTGTLAPLADAMTHATPLDKLATDGLAALMDDDERMAGLVATGAWTWKGLALILGGAFLIARGTIDWRLPAGVIVGTALTAAIFQFTGGAPVSFHLLSGATLLVAIFIASDPVTAPADAAARWAYAIGIGIIAIIIRELGGHPDGFAFAVLMLNAAAPLLDYIFRRMGER